MLYSPDVWVSRCGCLFEYVMVSWSYDLSKTDEALNLKQWKFWVRNNGNNNSDCFENDPRMANIYVSNCSCYCPSTAVSLVQESMPLRFPCEMKKFTAAISHISSHMAILLRNFCVIPTTLCIYGTIFHCSKLVIKLKGGFIKRFYHLT